MAALSRSGNCSPRNRQQKGVILILALLIVALVTTVVVSVSWRFSLSMARNENRWHGSQARLYLESAEEIAMNALYQDKTMPQTSQTDTSAEFWNQEVQFPIQEVDGWVGGRLEDANRRLNLNLMQAVEEQDPADPKIKRLVMSPMQERFTRLLQMIELESGPVDLQMATDIAWAVSDWIDPDSNLGSPNSAERDFYENLDPPYPIANGPMTSVSDLLMIKGMTPELYEKVLPYVFAYPVKTTPGAGGQPQAIPEESKLNVNTMPPILLRTFNTPKFLQPLDEQQLEFFQMPMSEQGFTDVSEFKQAMEALVPAGANPQDQLQTDDLTTKSYYFILYAETQVGEQYRRGSSLLYRNDQGAVQVLRRTESLF